MQKISSLKGAVLALGLTTLAVAPATAADAAGAQHAPSTAQAIALEKAHEALRAARAGKDTAHAVSTATTARRTTEIRRPDGSVELRLGEEHDMYSVATLNDNGDLQLVCLPNEEAKALMSAAAQKDKAKAAQQQSKESNHVHK